MTDELIRVSELPLVSAASTDTFVIVRGDGKAARSEGPTPDFQIPSITDFGATTGSPDNILNVQEAINTTPMLGEVYVPEGEYRVSDIPTSEYGVSLNGPGKVLASDNYGGREQVNTYAGTRPVGIGREYLWAVYNVMQSTNRAIRCYIYGDSTVEGGFEFLDWPFFVQTFIPDAVAAKGVRNYFSVTNRGVGGSNLSTWNPTPDIGVNSSTAADIVILKCGINDGSFPRATRLETFKTNLRAGLAAIRAVSGGDVGSTAILVVGPNITIDKQFHTRNAEWYEQLRGIFESACHDYKCAYFDTYEYLRYAGGEDDSLWAKDRWLDTSNAPGQNPVSLHPKNVGQSWIWGGIVDWIFSDSAILRWSSNKVYGRSAYFGHPIAKLPPDVYPSNYPSGITTEIATVAGGFPIDGMLTTIKNPDGFMMRFLSSNTQSGLILTQTTDVAGNFYSPWSGINQAITFANGWSNFGGSYGGARASVSSTGVVTLDGLIKPGTTTAGTKIAQLPSGMNPGNQRILCAMSDVGAVPIEIFADGGVTLRSGTPAVFVSLSGIGFRR